MVACKLARLNRIGHASVRIPVLSAGEHSQNEVRVTPVGLYDGVVPTITQDAGEDVDDQAYVNFVEACFREIRNLTVVSKKRLDGDTIYKISSDGMLIYAVLGRNIKVLEAIGGPILLLTWRLPVPFPFLANTYANLTYFDLTYHLSSSELSKVAWKLRHRIEANGIGLTRFRHERSGNLFFKAIRSLLASRGRVL